MIYAQRRLSLIGSLGSSHVDVTIETPQRQATYWACAYRIGWPEGTRSGEARGADAVQSLYLAMESIAVAIYASEHHRAGRLYWQKPGRGYGFPMPKPARDELVGDDRELQL